MTMENPPFEDVVPIGNGGFTMHVSFQGCTWFDSGRRFVRNCMALMKSSCPYWDNQYQPGDSK